MINGFPEETKELTHEEFKISGYVVKGLRTKTGKKNAITSKKMIAGLKEICDIEVDGPRLRKIINYIRTQGIITNLVATSSGYYIEERQEEIDTYVESLYQRAEAIIAVAKSYKSTINDQKFYGGI